MKHKKVLFIADHLKGGGAERILLEVAENLANSYEVVIALMDANDIRMQVHPHIQCIHLDINKEFMSGSLWRRRNRQLNTKEINKINSLINLEKPDLIILSHWYAFHCLPYIQGNVWVWVHGDIFNPVKKKTPNLFRWYKETRRVLYERKYFPELLDGKNLIVVNHDLKQRYQPYIPNAKIKVIHNGINLDKYKSYETVTSEKKWDCIFVGRLSPEKQPDYALRAFAQSQLKGRMAFIGDGKELPQLIQIASELGVADRIDFLGWIEEVEPYISNSHLLIMSSEAEGFGLVIAEALALDIPVVAFNCSEGVNFQLNTKNLRSGLVEPQNLLVLAEKINQTYMNPYPISSEDKKRLSIQRMINEFEKLF